MPFLKELLNVLKLAWDLPRLSKEMKRVQRIRRGRPFPKKKPEKQKNDIRAVFIGSQLVCLDCMTDEDWKQYIQGSLVTGDFLKEMNDACCDRCAKNLLEQNKKTRNKKQLNLTIGLFVIYLT